MALAASAMVSATGGARAASTTRSQLDVAALYRRYGDMVLGRCRNLLGNDADAAEICQEVFLKLHRYQHSFRGESSPSTYLFKITTTTCLNKLRSRKRRPEDPVEEPIVVPHTDTMLSHVALRDLAARVTSLADEGTRLCLVYHYVDGMTHAEVGELLGISAGAVRKRIRVFRKKVQDNPPSWLVEADWP